MKKSIVLTLLVCFALMTPVIAQTGKTQKETFQSTYNDSKALVESKSFQFVGNYVYSNKNREKLEEENSTLVLLNEKLKGQITTLSTYGEKLLTFNETIKDYQVSFNDEKQEISIQFKANNTTFYLDIKPNGNVFLTARYDTNVITQVGKIKKI